MAASRRSGRSLPQEIVGRGLPKTGKNYRLAKINYYEYYLFNWSIV